MRVSEEVSGASGADRLSGLCASDGTEFDVVVIGGGAAGMLSSAIAAVRGARVLLMERNERLGRKLSLTGKGRCNLTNNCTVGEVLDNVATGGRFLHSALNGFTPSDTMGFFTDLGVPVKTERGNRVFPSSDKASDVTAALRRYMDDSGVIARRCRARRIDGADGRVTGVATRDAKIKCKAVILATGGMSYPSTGSTGDGYSIAGDHGHAVTPPRGALAPINAEPDTCIRMKGLTLKNVSFKLFDGGKKPVFEDFGELLFTHFGMSGPVALSASAHIRDLDDKRYRAVIDLKPALDEKRLDLRVLRDFKKYANRSFSNSLGDLLSKSMIPVIVERSGIEPSTKVHSIRRDQRLGLVKVIKGFGIDIDGLRPIEEAIITSGGVRTAEIDPKTMESKLIKGLFFAGEIIDADAYTGGFNLQIAWSTAFSAGNAAGVMRFHEPEKGYSPGYP